MPAPSTSISSFPWNETTRRELKELFRSNEERVDRRCTSCRRTDIPKGQGDMKILQLHDLLLHLGTRGEEGVRMQFRVSYYKRGREVICSLLFWFTEEVVVGGF